MVSGDPEETFRNRYDKMSEEQRRSLFTEYFPNVDWKDPEAIYEQLERMPYRNYNKWSLIVNQMMEFIGEK